MADQATSRHQPVVIRPWRSSVLQPDAYVRSGSGADKLPCGTRMLQVPCRHAGEALPAARAQATRRLRRRSLVPPSRPLARARVPRTPYRLFRALRVITQDVDGAYNCPSDATGDATG